MSSSLQLLLIEDDAQDAALLEQFLAVEEIERRGNEIDLVLMDLAMPGLDGRETLRRLRHLRPGIRVILSTGYDAAVATEGVPEGEFDGFLQKPFEPNELAAIVKRCLAEGDPQREVAFSRSGDDESERATGAM